MHHALSLLLSENSYKIPTVNGYCGSYNSTNIERCYCKPTITTENVQTKCMSYCNIDDNCAGYVFSLPQFSEYPDCAFYTVSSSPEGCTKKFGDTGHLITRPVRFLSGCHIKLGTV